MQRSHRQLIETEPAYREHIRKTNPHDFWLWCWENLVPGDFISKATAYVRAHATK